MFRCGTCGKLVPQVMRVVIDRNYNRADDLNPLYNCPECFEKKNRERKIYSKTDPAEGDISSA